MIWIAECMARTLVVVECLKAASKLMKCLQGTLEVAIHLTFEGPHHRH